MRAWLLRLYPRAWRRRYGAEFAALLAEQPLTPVSVLDVVRGALDAHRMAWHEQEAHTSRIQPGRGKERVMKRGRDEYSCSFCGKSKDAVRRLIAGPGGVMICNECIALCNEILAEEEQHMPPAAAPESQGSAGRRRPARRWWQRLLSRQHQAQLQLSSAD